MKSFLATDPELRCGSIHVYRAVLEDGVRTPDEFQQWRADRDTTSLTDWRPTVTPDATADDIEPPLSQSTARALIDNGAWDW